MTTDKVYIGTRLKFSLNIEVNGKSIFRNKDEYQEAIPRNLIAQELNPLYEGTEIIFKSDTNEVVKTITENTYIENNQCIIPIDTEELGTGKIIMIVKVHIHDKVFEDETRIEVDKKEILYISPI